MEEPVRSQARLDQTKRLSNAILRRTVVNVVLFIVVYLVLFAGFMTTLGSAVSNFVYELLGYDYALHTLASNLFLVLTLSASSRVSCSWCARASTGRCATSTSCSIRCPTSWPKATARSCCPASLRPPLWRSTPSRRRPSRTNALRSRRGSQERAGGVSGA